MAVNTLLSIGHSALMAHQTSINVTGNNIANVETEGYSRRLVSYSAYSPISTNSGQIGMGTQIQEITRSFNLFAEMQYLNQNTTAGRWETQYSILTSCENLFNEANSSGINSALGMFFQDWQDLTTEPDSASIREVILADANNLTQLFRTTQQNLQNLQNDMDLFIQQSVADVNNIMSQLQQVNLQIMKTTNSHNTPLALYDQRDQLIRELSQYLDVEVQYRHENPGVVTVLTASGQPLVDGTELFSLEVRDAIAESKLVPHSNYAGDIQWSGKDGYEYTIEILSGGDVGTDEVTFRVSLDGGKTWLRDDNGDIATYTIPDDVNPDGSTLTVKVKDLEISFSDATNFTAGDSFTITPKTGLYWISPTRGAMNITPQTYGDGTENSLRITGGSLTAYFITRDQQIQDYMDQMNALAKAIIWETNLAHSQGAGTQMLSTVLGTYAVEDSTAALNLSSTGLTFYDRLEAGNISFSFFDEFGDPAGTETLIFWDNSTVPPTAEGFDPEKHSLQDVVDAINDLKNRNPAADINASIVGGQLYLTSGADTTFAINSDTSGLMAALGVNTFFTGTGATDIAVNEMIQANTAFINSGAVNANGMVDEGDNAIARAIAELETKGVKISTGASTKEQSIVAYHALLVSQVGADVRTAKFNAQYYRALSDEMNELCLSVSGVNLDEEMTNLIKFQHSYTAAAKLITTADQMLQTILSLKD